MARHKPCQEEVNIFGEFKRYIARAGLNIRERPSVLGTFLEETTVGSFDGKSQV